MLKEPDTNPQPDSTGAQIVGDVLTRTYRHGELAGGGFPLGDAAEQLATPDTIVWIDLCGPSREQLHDLALQFGLHDLAVEDSLGQRRAKLDRYETHLFVSCHALGVDIEAATLAETQVAAFVGPRWLITVRDNAGFPLRPVLERWDRSPALAAHGVSFLLYALLDAVVDGYFDVIEAFDDYFAAVSERIFSGEPDLLADRQWFDMRRAMFRFHRLAVPMREVCGGIVRREHGSVVEEVYPYFLDVYDHVLGVVEDLDSLREVASTILEADLSIRDHRQNLVVKQVTSWAAIIAVPTLVTGYYGMNVPYPGEGELSGVVTSTAVMIVACIVLYHVFRRHRWL
jgi:magnesium transporter